MSNGRVKYSSTWLLESDISLECFQKSGKLPGKQQDTYIDQVCVWLSSKTF